MRKILSQPTHISSYSADNCYMHVVRQLVIWPMAISSLLILTGCHLSRVPFPASSMAAIAVSVGGLLGVHLLVALTAKSLKLAGEARKPTA
jgi:hypothetical protein